MRPVHTPDELMTLSKTLVGAGASGLLLSGGCDASGKVPLSPYLETVKRIKEDTPLKVNLHPGLANPEEAEHIALSGADRISFDLVLDEAVVHNDMHLNVPPSDHLRSFHSLCRAAPGRVAPHILLGLGEEEKEMEAVRAAVAEEVPCVILLSLLGKKVDDWDGRLLRAVKAAAPYRPVLLGCMRPRGRPDVEMAALDAGAVGIACPSPATVRSIEDRGWEAEWRKECCALYR